MINKVYSQFKLRLATKREELHHQLSTISSEDSDWSGNSSPQSYSSISGRLEVVIGEIRWIQFPEMNNKNLKSKLFIDILSEDLEGECPSLLGTVDAKTCFNKRKSMCHQQLSFPVPKKSMQGLHLVLSRGSTRGNKFGGMGLAMAYVDLCETLTNGLDEAEVAIFDPSGRLLGVVDLSLRFREAAMAQ